MDNTTLMFVLGGVALVGGVLWHWLSAGTATASGEPVMNLVTKATLVEKEKADPTDTKGFAAWVVLRDWMRASGAPEDEIKKIGLLVMDHVVAGEPK